MGGSRDLPTLLAIPTGTSEGRLGRDQAGRWGEGRAMLWQLGNEDRPGRGEQGRMRPRGAHSDQEARGCNLVDCK